MPRPRVLITYSREEGSGLSFLKRLLRVFRTEGETPETHPPRALGIYIDDSRSLAGGPYDCASSLARKETTFRELVLDFDWILHRQKQQGEWAFVHIDDVIDPLLCRIKTDFLHHPADGDHQLRRAPLINDIARDAKHAGCGAWLAWTAGEMLDYGPPASDAGRAFIRQLVTRDSDDETLTVLALLADLKEQSGLALPHVSAHSLRKETVIVTSTVLRDAERAMKWVSTLEGGASINDRLRPLFENELHTFRRCMVDDEPLLRWVGLAATQLVMTETCRAVSSMPEDLHAPFVRLVVEWVTRDVGTENGPSIFAASKLLPLLWGRFPAVMPREAGVRFEHAGLAVQSCILTSAFDALETASRGRKRVDLPDFVADGDRLLYVAPAADPWKDFGIIVARIASAKAILRAQVEARMARLRASRRFLTKR